MEQYKEYIDKRQKFTITLNSGKVIKEAKLRSVAGGEPIFVYIKGKHKFWLREEDISTIKLYNKD